MGFKNDHLYYSEEDFMADQHRQIKKLRAQLGLTPVQIKTKKCLKCDKDFKSAGPQNRVCKGCNKTAKNHIDE
jgi:tRNA(Ile2) C34 agmatinyltransferase TiaS